MEKETKRCPYCGEEILIVAKKCKHCGEWLEEVASVSENKEKDPISKLQLVKELKETTGVSLYDAKDAIDATDGDIEAAKVYLKEKGVAIEDTPNDVSIDANQENKIGDSNIDIPLWATIFFWIAVWGSFASWLQECGIDHGGHGKWELFIDIANWIPYWLTLALGWIGEAGLVFLLMNMTKRIGKPIGFLCISLMILLAVGVYYDYMESLYWLDENQESFQFVIVLMTMFCYVVIGIMLIRNYTNALKSLGIVFLAYPPIIILYGFISPNIFTEIELVLLGGLFITIAYLYAFKEGLTDAFNDPKDSNSSSMIMVGSLIAAAIAAGLLSMCDSEISSLDSSNSTDVKNNKISDSGVTTPNGTMSAKTFLELDNLVSYAMDDKIAELLAECGYEYIGKNEYDRLYYSKNCKLIRSEYGYEPTSITENSSYIEFSKGEHVQLWAFSENCFKAWCKDLESLGYKGEGPNKGNQGQDWGYEKDDEYTVCIWNDYENTYSITVLE